MSIAKSIKAVLREANLSSYLEQFQKLGADDPQQIAKMTESSFLLLLEHVGMSEKPFHVSRLLTILAETYGVSPSYEIPPVPEKSKLVYQGQPEFVSRVNYAMFESVGSTRRRNLKPYYGQVELPSDEVFAECTDVRSEEETHELITQLAAIYKGSKLNKYQQYINACAAELAVRDPTLLARRSVLIEKAREVNVRGGKFKFNRGFSSSKYASDEPVRKGEANFAVANRHREKRLNEIRALESTVSSCVFQKEGLVERLKHETDRDNKVAIGTVRSRLDSLEEQIYVSKKKLSKLRLAQRRSEKYFSVKLAKHMNIKEDKESISNPGSPEVNTAPIRIMNSRKRRRVHSDEPATVNLNTHDIEISGDYTQHATSHYDSANQECGGIEVQSDILTDVFNSAMNVYEDISSGTYDTSMDPDHMAGGGNDVASHNESISIDPVGSVITVTCSSSSLENTLDVS